MVCVIIRGGGGGTVCIYYNFEGPSMSLEAFTMLMVP